jgi:hypothetical protein
MNDENDKVKEQFEFAQDNAKQLITLSTTVIALTLTFFKDFVAGASDWSRGLMTIAWIVFLVSVIVGVFHLFALTGALTTGTPSIINLNARVSSGIQQITFVIALALTVWAGALALGHSSDARSAPGTSSVSTLPPQGSQPVTTIGPPAPKR